MSRATKYVVAAVAAGVLCGALGLGGYRLWRPNRLLVRNSSGAAVRNVRLHLADDGRSRGLEQKVLRAGESVGLRHSMDMPTVTVEFSQSGTPVRHSRLLDYWRGEAVVCDIRPGGKVTIDYGRR